MINIIAEIGQAHETTNPLKGGCIYFTKKEVYVCYC